MRLQRSGFTFGGFVPKAVKQEFSGQTQQQSSLSVSTDLHRAVHRVHFLVRCSQRGVRLRNITIFGLNFATNYLKKCCCFCLILTWTFITTPVFFWDNLIFFGFTLIIILPCWSLLTLNSELPSNCTGVSATCGHLMALYFHFCFLFYFLLTILIWPWPWTTK